MDISLIIRVLCISFNNRCLMDISFLYRFPMEVSLVIGAPWISVLHRCPMDVSLIIGVPWISLLYYVSHGYLL